jgi:Putative Flp pilus-assembly TadE/G-like
MPWMQKSRRGSVLVLVAFMLAAFMGIAAIAADIGRFYVVTGELQTAADAAALKGAAVLQVLNSASPEPFVDDSVIAWVAATNRADNNALSTTADSVNLGFWNPDTRTLENLNGRRANAVSVTLSRRPVGVFSQMIGRTAGLPLSRQAIAWIANISLNCMRPWAFPYAPFYRRVNGVTSTTYPPPDLDPLAMIAFQKTSQANRTFIVLPPESAYPFPLANDSSWRGYNPPSNANGNANSGKDTFQEMVSGCDGIARNSDAGNGNTVPNSGNGGSCGAPNQTACWTLEVINGEPAQGNNPARDGICAAFRGADAGCYANTSTQQRGVTVDIAWSDIVGNGQSVDFRYVGEFELQCFFSASTQTCADIPGNDPALKTGYPPGTVVGFASGLKSRKLNPTDLISNAPTNVQRLLLVK